VREDIARPLMKNVFRIGLCGRHSWRRI
jgi:hypothetical protein